MGELDQFCTKCGLGTQAFDPVDKRKSSNKKRGFRWWMIPLFIVFIGAVLLIAMWSRFSLYFAPEIQLVEALTNTGADFSQRMEGSPLAVIAQASEWEEGFTSTVSLDLSVIGFEGFGAAVSSATDLEKNQFMVSSQQKLFGMTGADFIYADEDQAVFVQDTPGGTQAYSVTFDGLSNALEGDVFAGMTDDEKEAFRTSLADLQVPSESADRESLNKRYVQIFIDILKNSERSVSYENRMLEGRTRNCGVITYSVNNFVLAQGLEELAKVTQDDGMLRSSYLTQRQINALDFMSGDDGEEQQDTPGKLQQAAETLRQDRNGGIDVTFHLFEKKVVRFCISRQSQGSTVFSVDAELGVTPSEGDVLILLQNAQGQSTYLYRTETNGNVTTERLTVSKQEGVGAVSCTWDAETGSFPITLQREGETIQIDGQLIRSDDGFNLELPDVLGLLGADGIGELGFMQSLAQLDLSIEVSRGADLQIPQGKPIEEWTRVDVKFVQNEFLN